MESKGNGRYYSGWRGNDHKRYNKLSWKDPEMTRSHKPGKTMTPKRQADRYNKLSRNPSGAPNMQTTT